MPPPTAPTSLPARPMPGIMPAGAPRIAPKLEDDASLTLLPSTVERSDESIVASVASTIARSLSFGSAGKKRPARSTDIKDLDTSMPTGGESDLIVPAFSYLQARLLKLHGAEASAARFGAGLESRAALSALMLVFTTMAALDMDASAWDHGHERIFMCYGLLLGLAIALNVFSLTVCSVSAAVIARNLGCAADCSPLAVLDLVVNLVVPARVAHACVGVRLESNTHLVSFADNDRSWMYGRRTDRGAWGPNIALRKHFWLVKFAFPPLLPNARRAQCCVSARRTPPSDCLDQHSW